jgi:predicted Rossmann-fold nucleotide-binding protein
VLAICRKKAQECRERASRISFPDLREHAEQTAKMCEELAAFFGGGGALEEFLPLLRESKDKQN